MADFRHQKGSAKDRGDKRTVRAFFEHEGAIFMLSTGVCDYLILQWSFV